MTTVAILTGSPHEDHLANSFASSPLSASERTGLWRAMLADVTTAVDASGGETLVNYLDQGSDHEEAGEAASGDDGGGEEEGGDGGGGDDEGGKGGAEDDRTDVEAELREFVAETLGSLEDVRFEPQVGSTHYGRVGNTITHLLEREGTYTAAVVEPSAPFLTRSVIDSAAMKLRSSDVVLGPTTDGRVYYAGFGEPIDFTEAFDPPAVETLAERSRDAGLSVDFLPMMPVLERPSDLHTVVPAIRSRRVAERIAPERTAAVIEDLGLFVRSGEDGTLLVRE